jgi:PPK2 family polyphosphate:nucleotide phosphotransferase
MLKRKEIVDLFRVKPGAKLRLKDHDPDWDGDDRIPKEDRKKTAAEVLTQDVSQLADAQELLYADDSRSLLVIFQALDAAGKDGTIKHVMSGINPQGCQVYSFKQPSPEELDHDFLWRCAKCVPERGRIGIFNRSYYEEVLVVKVHPELVRAERIPGADPSDEKFWEHRYESINSWERHLARNGTAIVKFFLNVSKGEQKKRFLARINEPEKHWKFSAGDLAERAYWDDYQRAYQECLEATSTKHAPWYVVPADNKWVTRAAVAIILTETIRGLDLQWPKVSPEQKKSIAEAKRKLERDS